jgi:hypothetical protein
MSKEFTIDPEFKGLIPPLSAGEYKQLEDNILAAKKCRDALITWQGKLVDGHNRYQICTEHEIKYTTAELKLDSRDDVILWIVKNQFGRRNLTKRQTEYCRGKQYETEKQVVTNKLGNNQHSKNGEAVAQNDTQPKNAKETEMFTAERLAGQHKVSPATIKRDAKFSNVVDAIGAVSPEAKIKILLGDTKISKQALMKLAKASKEEIEAVARQIAGDTYVPVKNEAKKESDIEETLNELEQGLEQGDKGVHEVFFGFVDVLEQSYSRIDKYLEKKLSVPDNQKILGRLNAHANHLNHLIQKLTKKQSEDMDADVDTASEKDSIVDTDTDTGAATETATDTGADTTTVTTTDKTSNEDSDS